MRLTRIIRWAWLLELEPQQLEVILRMLAETELQTARRLLREALREKPRDEELRKTLALLEELEENT